MLGGLGVDPQPTLDGGGRRDRADRHDERLRVGKRADEVAEVVDGRRRRERDRVDLAGAHPLERRDPGWPAPSGRRGGRRPRSRAREPVGQHVACLLGAGEQHARAVDGRRRERLEQRLGDEALGDQVGADAARGQLARGAGSDGGDADTGERPASSPAGARPRSKNASTPLAEVNTSHSYAARSGTVKSIGSISMAGSSRTSAPSASSAHPQLAGLLARARDDDRPAEQRTRLEPGEVERGDVAHDDRARRPHAGVGDGREGRPHRLLIGPGAVAHRGDRRVRRAAALDQPAGDLADAPGAHEDHERAAGARERVPVDVGAVLGRVLVAGDHGEVRRHAAVGDRDAGVRRRPDGAGDAGDDLERDPGGGQGLGLLAAAAEHERIAALEAHDAAGATPGLDEHLVDLLLGEVDLPGCLARGDELGAGGARARSAGDARRS